MTWNAEDRLVEVESAVNVPGQARMREEWTHLPDGRWIERIVSTNSGGVYYPAYTNRFIWDRQVLLAILDHTNGVVASFMRGSDLSGSIQGAGGVGGVLAVNFGLSTPSQPSTHMVSYDGNGNVVALHNAADGSESATYEYGPFSEPIRVTGPVASLMPLRFSTMYEDNITSDRKYLFRDYTPSTGRWKSRDPIREMGFELRRKRALPSVGGFNAVSRDKDPAYTVLLNTVPNDIDLLGLCDAYCNKCGEDVTLSIFQTLDDVRQTYEDAPWWTKRIAAYYMFTFSSMESWDIKWLKNYTSDRWMGCNAQSSIRGCYETITFEGKCVSIHELNYIMYGWAARFTTLGEGDARTLIYIAQVGLFYRFADDPATLARKVGFAEYGAQLYPLSPAWLAWPHQCEIHLGRKDVDIHDWNWRGLKE